MKQIALPGLEPVALPVEETFLPVEQEGGQVALAADKSQLDLFADKVEVEREIDHALRTGDFDCACRLRDVHRATYGVTAATARLGFLDALGSIGGAEPIGALCAWELVDEDLWSQPTLRRQVRDGVFRRLLSSHAPAELAGVRPTCLAALASFLTAEAVASGAESSPEARRLVRDALLAGRALTAKEIEGDASLSDLLGEGLAAGWLACLGAVRRLWPVPAVTEAELRGLEGGDGFATAGDDSLRFWWCLRVAETPRRPERLLHEARRRMKRLSPDLHALHMRRARPPEEA